MHRSSIENMEKFRSSLKASGMVLDVGSHDPKMEYRRIFDGWKYTGLDIIRGKNVDYVPRFPYRWYQILNGYFDAVISGQALEHIQYPQKTFDEISRVLKPRGKCCIIAPSAGPPHSNSSFKWYGNFSMDRMKNLAINSGLKIIDLFIDEHPPWHDCVLIAEKESENGL